MWLTETEAYRSKGLLPSAIDSLAILGDILLESHVNVTSVREPVEIEKQHFLDSLSLLDLDALRAPRVSVVDVGSGGGFPGLVLAIALPETEVTMVESVRKKCAFIQEAAGRLALSNVTVDCQRAEDAGRGRLRETFDVAVVRAVGPLAVVAEYATPLVQVGGLFVAMKGLMSYEEREAGLAALAILGVDRVEERTVTPFPEAEHRRLVLGMKRSMTPKGYPRSAGVPAKRPLGEGAKRARP